MRPQPSVAVDRYEIRMSPCLSQFANGASLIVDVLLGYVTKKSDYLSCKCLVLVKQNKPSPFQCRLQFLSSITVSAVSEESLLYALRHILH
jgi:hypothetical protein